MSQCHNVTGKWVANLQTVKQTILTFIHVKLQVLPLTLTPALLASIRLRCAQVTHSLLSVSVSGVR